jgi:hypothetical protein
MGTIVTRKVLIEETKAPYWVITHLTVSGRLPLLHKATGKGDVNIYSPGAIEVLNKWMSRGDTDESQ